MLRGRRHDVRLALILFEDDFWSDKLLGGAEGHTARSSRLERIARIEHPESVLLSQSALLTERVLGASDSRTGTIDIIQKYIGVPVGLIT